MRGARAPFTSPYRSNSDLCNQGPFSPPAARSRWNTSARCSRTRDRSCAGIRAAPAHRFRSDSSLRKCPTWDRTTDPRRTRHPPPSRTYHQTSLRWHSVRRRQTRLQPPARRGSVRAGAKAISFGSGIDGGHSTLSDASPPIRSHRDVPLQRRHQPHQPSGRGPMARALSKCQTDGLDRACDCVDKATNESGLLDGG